LDVNVSEGLRYSNQPNISIFDKNLSHRSILISPGFHTITDDAL
jgi:hypothetical protein